MNIMAGRLISTLVLLNLVITSFGQTCTSPTALCDCFIDKDGSKTISCRYKSLTQVPNFTASTEIYGKIIFTSTEETGKCTFGCNNITSLPANAFANLNVRHIDLRNNPITSYNPQAFQGLQTILNDLLIEGDGQIAPPYQSISVLQNLHLLHLENYLQTDITTSNTNLTFPQLISLTLKKFQGVTDIDRTVFATIPSVENLNLEHFSSMTILPVPAILVLQNLKAITIRDTRIARIFGDSFSSLDKLVSINLDGNVNLVTIDAHAFRGVEDTLEFLYLNHNSLTSSVLGIFRQLNWTALGQLHIGYNTLASIPNGTFRTMPNLVYLELQDVHLTAINSTMFTGLAKLHTLDLGYNNIESVSSGTFQHSPELRELRLNEQNTNNKPILFSSDAFLGIENSLQRLFIERNALDSGQLWMSLALFTNLLDVYVAEVGLTSVPDKAFQNNLKLTSVDLSGNGITTLTQQTFYGPRNTLTKINLQSNQIQTIDKCVFSDYAITPSVRLVSNPLVCDCHIGWLYDWVKSQTDTNTAGVAIGTCSSPQSLQGKFFFQFNKTDLTCPPNYVEPTCPDLYTTTTSATTTTTRTTTPRPGPDVQLSIGTRTRTIVNVTWTVSDTTEVSRYRLRKKSNNQTTVEIFVDRTKAWHEFDGLNAGRSYTFCLALEINNVLENTDGQCTQTTTPNPIFELLIGPMSRTSITVTWTVNDKTDITGYKLEKIPNSGTKENVTVHADLTQFTFHNLTPGETYYFCLILILNQIEDNSLISCKTGTLDNNNGLPTTKAATTAKPEAKTNTGIIVGVSVGGVVLVAILILIVVLLLRTAKQKKRAPMAAGVHFTSHAGVPQAGGTAKRFAKKTDKDNASPEDIGVTVISGADMNKDRMSAGSYQFLNEKDPSGVNKYPNGHYANDFDARPLPKAPGGATGYGRPGGSGYVNESFKDISTLHLPETSQNSYSEVKY